MHGKEYWLSVLKTVKEAKICNLRPYTILDDEHQSVFIWKWHPAEAVFHLIFLISIVFVVNCNIKSQESYPLNDQGDELKRLKRKPKNRTLYRDMTRIIIPSPTTCRSEFESSVTQRYIRL